MDNLVEFENRVRECLKRAEVLFGVRMHFVEVHLTLKGTTAGQALYRTMKATGSVMRYQLYFNAEGIKIDWNQMVNSTIPHEVAHMVGYIVRRFGYQNPQVPWKPSLIKNHNEYFQKAASLLGDCEAGARCHSLSLQKSKKQTRHLYIIPESNEQLKVSTTIHNKIRKGHKRFSRRTKYVLQPWHYKGPVE